MSRITSSVGLISGIQITDLVNQLIAFSARPRDALQKRNDGLEEQQLSLSALSTQLIGFQVTARRLASATLYDVRTSASSNSATLAVTSKGKPPIGSFTFTPLQAAQAQKLVSTGLASRTAPLAAGTISLGLGGFIDSGASLDVLNSGAGVARGQIRITDRSGASAVVDLRTARSVDDVLKAINSASGINVKASASTDGFRLVDSTGATTANLKVEEVGGGTTAASLGLAGVNVAADSVDGQRVFQLFNSLSLAQLNDGAGVTFDRFVEDLEVTLRDGSDPIKIDFQRLGTPTSQISATTPGEGRADAQVKFTAAVARQDLVGTQIKFVDDDTIARGQETVAYDAQAKTLTFRINQGETTASDVVASVNRTSEVSALFKAALPTANNGTGLVVLNDEVTLGGPKSTLTTTAANGANASVRIDALASSPDLDGTTLVFEHDGGITQGNETVAYNAGAKTITVKIAEGQSTAANVIAALNADATFAATFKAQQGSAGDGTGLVAATDTAAAKGGAVITATNEQTLGDLIATINAAAPGKLQAAIAADGKRIALTDLTTDNGGTFAVTSLNKSKVAEEFGLTAAASGGQISGRRVFAGLKTSLLSSLKGGAGLGSLGLLSITDRSGAAASVDLSTAETVQEVLDLVNAAGIGVAARVNDARNGIALSDTTGSTGNLIVANGDAQNTADALGLTTNAAVSTANSGSLNRQLIGESTLLSSLNAGRGVAKGTLSIRDTAGVDRVINLKSDAIRTVGDVLAEINGASLGVKARLNAQGSGIELVDTALGAGTLQVTAGDGTTAADLNLLRTSKTIDISGTPTQVIDGSAISTIALSGAESLDQLVARINGLNVGITASVVSDGSSFQPFRLNLESGRTGQAGAIQIDASALGTTFSETQSAQDAVLQVGGAGGQLVASATGKFDGVVDGLSLQVLQASAAPVTVSVSRDSSQFVTVVKDLATKYNDIRKQIDKLTDPDTGILQGSTDLLQVQDNLADIFSSVFSGAGNFRSARDVGISTVAPAIDPETNQFVGALTNLGQLQVDEAKLVDLFNNNLSGLQAFFSTKDRGLSSRLDRSLDRLAAGERSLLLNRLTSINQTLQDNQTTLDRMQAQLNSERERLLTSFYNAEVAIAKLQANQSALNNLANLVVSSSNSSSN